MLFEVPQLLYLDSFRGAVRPHRLHGDTPLTSLEGRIEFIRGGRNGRDEKGVVYDKGDKHII